MSIALMFEVQQKTRYAALVNLAEAVKASRILPDDAPQYVIEAHANWIDEAERSYLEMLVKENPR